MIGKTNKQDIFVKCFQEVDLQLGWYTSQPFACLQVDNAERILTETETLNSYVFKLFQSDIPKDSPNNLQYFIFIGCIYMKKHI